METPPNEKPENNAESDGDPLLTSIHGTYTLSNTREGISELDQQTVQNFLNTLAEIALAIASRKAHNKEVI
jgi:hypothetical protein